MNESKETTEVSAKALVEMYQAGWYDGYNLKKRKRVLWKNVIRKCELSFIKRFPVDKKI